MNNSLHCENKLKYMYIKNTLSSTHKQQWSPLGASLYWGWGYFLLSYTYSQRCNMYHSRLVFLYLYSQTNDQCNNYHNVHATGV